MYRALRRTAGLTTLAGCALAGTAMARPPVVVPPHPLGNPGDWVTPDDYPPRALHNNEAGNVGFVLSYDVQGKVTGCEITASSGSADLDEATCTSLMARAGFKPGTKGGKPEAGVYRSSVRWQIPQNVDDVPESQTVSIAYTINADGHVSDCVGTDEKGVQHPIPAGNGPPACANAAVLKPAKDAAGKPVSKRVTMIFTTKVEDVP